MPVDSADHHKRGILCRLEPKRAGEVEERLRETGEFTDVLSIYDFDLKGSDIYLLSLDPGVLNYAAVGTRGQRVATAKATVRFTHAIDLDSLSCEEIVSRVPKRLRRHLKNMFSGLGGRIAQGSWLATWDAVLELRPDLAGPLNALLSHRDDHSVKHIGPVFETVAQEKDAVFTAARIFGYPVRTILQTLEPVEGEHPAPFLRQISGANVIEDIMIAHDQHVFGDWLPWKDMQVGAVELCRTTHRGQERMTIVNAIVPPLSIHLGWT